METGSTPTPEKLAAHPEQAKAFRPFRSSFIFGLGLFLALNWALSFYTPFNFDPYKFGYRGWAWWTMNDLRKQQETNNIALLGSSLMVSAIAGCDSNYLNKGLDLANYHKASYFEHLLRTRYGGTFNTFSLAAPGQMPSDALLTLKAMVNTAQRPDIVIYGVAPRDFIDSTLSSPADTEPFRYFRRLVNADDLTEVAFRKSDDKLEWWLQRAVYLYGSSLDFRLSFNEALNKFLAASFPAPWTNKPFTWWDRVRLLPRYMPGEIHPEAVMAGPITRETAEFKDNTLEYMSRYRNPDPRTYKLQFHFLKELAEFCHKERMELIIVNMPITLYNVGMLPQGAYVRYLSDLQQFSTTNGTSFYNLANFNSYEQRGDFHDSVHLNAFGAKKFFDSLATTLQANNRSSSLIGMSGQNMQKHQALAEKKFVPAM